jgi:hypothetical protein
LEVVVVVPVTVEKALVVLVVLAEAVAETTQHKVVALVLLVKVIMVL